MDKQSTEKLEKFGKQIAKFDLAKIFFFKNGVSLPKAFTNCCHFFHSVKKTKPSTK